MPGHLVEAGRVEHDDALVVLLREAELAVPGRVRMGGAGDVVRLAGAFSSGVMPGGERVEGERIVERHVDVRRRTLRAVARGQHDGRRDERARATESPVRGGEPDEADAGVDRVRPAAGDRHGRRGGQQAERQQGDRECEKPWSSNHWSILRGAVSAATGGLVGARLGMARLGPRRSGDRAGARPRQYASARRGRRPRLMRWHDGILMVSPAAHGRLREPAHAEAPR